MTVQLTTYEDDDGTDGAVGDILAVAPVTLAPVGQPVDAEDDPLQDAAVADVLRLLEANRRLQSALEANAVLCERSLQRMLEGDGPDAAIGDTDVAAARLALVHAQAEFERARHRARGTFITAQFARGMNMKEIGRRWAISRQLAHRFLKEARQDG